MTLIVATKRKRNVRWVIILLSSLDENWRKIFRYSSYYSCKTISKPQSFDYAELYRILAGEWDIIKWIVTMFFISSMKAVKRQQNQVKLNTFPKQWNSHTRIKKYITWKIIFDYVRNKILERIVGVDLLETGLLMEEEMQWADCKNCKRRNFARCKGWSTGRSCKKLQNSYIMWRDFQIIKKVEEDEGKEDFIAVSI